jgi:hypothetical protein
LSKSGVTFQPHLRGGADRLNVARTATARESDSDTRTDNSAAREVIGQVHVRSGVMWKEASAYVPHDSESTLLGNARKPGRDLLVSVALAAETRDLGDHRLRRRPMQPMGPRTAIA